MPKVDEASLGWLRASLPLDQDGYKTGLAIAREENKTRKKQQQRENHEIIVHDDVQYIIHSH